jgi:hypothetical protein
MLYALFLLNLANFRNLDGIDCKNHKDIRARLNFLAGQGIVPGSKIANLIKRCPELLFSANLNQMEITFDSLSGFFPKKSVSFYL